MNWTSACEFHPLQELPYSHFHHFTAESALLPSFKILHHYVRTMARLESLTFLRLNFQYHQDGADDLALERLAGPEPEELVLPNHSSSHLTIKKRYYHFLPFSHRNSPLKPVALWQAGIQLSHLHGDTLYSDFLKLPQSISQPPPGLGLGFNAPPRIAGSNILASGTSTAHRSHMLLQSAPTARSSGMNTTVFTYVRDVLRQSGILNKEASQLSPLLEKNTPHRASLGRLTQVPFFHFSIGRGRNVFASSSPRQCLGPPEPA